MPLRLSLHSACYPLHATRRSFFSSPGPTSAPLFPSDRVFHGGPTGSAGGVLGFVVPTRASCAVFTMLSSRCCLRPPIMAAAAWLGSAWLPSYNCLSSMCMLTGVSISTAAWLPACCACGAAMTCAGFSSRITGGSGNTL
ncbi:hypothetical protein MRX96_036033 [Rhipicephalus microplus]